MIFFYRKRSETAYDFESNKEISNYISKLSEENNNKGGFENENSKSESNKEECSEADEDLIRDILKMRKPMGISQRQSKIKFETSNVQIKSSSKQTSNNNSPKEAKNTREASSSPIFEEVLILDEMLAVKEEVTEPMVDNTVDSESSEEVYTCEHCQIEFNEQSDLTNHLLENHRNIFEETDKKPVTTTKKRVYRCIFCDYSSGTKSALTYHKRNKHGWENDNHKCHFCSYNTNHKNVLLRHTKNAHLAIVKKIRTSLDATKEKFPRYVKN